MKKLPIEEKIRRGTFNATRDKVRQFPTPTSDEPETIQRPRWLTGQARKIWDKKVEIYKSRNQRVAGFEDSLAQYCVLESVLIEHYRKKITPSVSMINAHKSYAKDFFDLPGDQLKLVKPDENSFKKNGI